MRIELSLQLRQRPEEQVRHQIVEVAQLTAPTEIIISESHVHSSSHLPVPDERIGESLTDQSVGQQVEELPSSGTVEEQVVEAFTSRIVEEQSSEASAASPTGIDIYLRAVAQQVGAFSAVNFHVRGVAQCEGSCKCSCHFRFRYRTPQLLDRVVGALFVGYAGLPLLRPTCNIGTCLNQLTRSLQVSYTFPAWLLAKTVNIVTATTCNGEPTLGLKVRNRVEYTSENSIFCLARNGDNAGIISLFQKREASPNDIAIRGGQTALNVSAISFCSNPFGPLSFCFRDHGLNSA